MSTVIIQVGQCGNQVGKEVWTVLTSDKSNNLGHVYVHQEGYVRSINVDSEPRVLRSLAECTEFRIRPSNILGRKRGSGTNWALGYYGSSMEQGDSLLKSTMDAVRKEVERCSSFSGFIMMHSISGGTGSGLGSRLCEVLQDEYPLHQMINCVVAPHSSGESPLQHYNALLCLASLQRHSDCILWFHNDDVLNRLQKRSTNHPNAGISFVTMNQHIAKCLSGLILPTDTVTSASGVSIGQEPWEFIRSVCPLPAQKFVLVNHVARRSSSWESLVGLLAHEQKQHNTDGKAYFSISNMMVIRGQLTESFTQQWSKIEKKIKGAFNPVNWNPFPVEYWTAQGKYMGNGNASSVTIATNHLSITEHLSSICYGAQLKYDAKAYLHWYEKYGCEQSEFDDAFVALNDCILNYAETAS